jgi:hypothetical protein
MIAVLNSRRLGEEIVNRFDLKKVSASVHGGRGQGPAAMKFKLTDAGMIDMSLEDRSEARGRDAPGLHDRSTASSRSAPRRAGGRVCSWNSG